MCYNIINFNDFIMEECVLPQIVKLSEGVEGLFIENSRFNTTLISFNFYLPLDFDTYSANALLPYVLSSCSKEYEDFRKLNIKLGNLYGATITTGNSKLMNYQCMNIAISVINDRYALGGECVVTEAAKLLASLIFNPSIEGNSFKKADVLREKTQMLDRIKGEINDKRGYARSTAVSMMFDKDPYSISRYGDYENMQKITGEDLFCAWTRLLRSAFIRVNVVGEKLPEGIFSAISAAFSAIHRENVTKFDGFKLPQFAFGSEKTERMDIAQGKLVLGFSLGKVAAESETAAATVMADIFGGGPYSRLFLNVREKMSLCYYCACQIVKNKGFMLVDSGVEAQNAEKAEKEIINQLNIMKNGEFSDDEFNASIRSICDSIKSAEDSPNTMNNWYAARVFDNSVLTPSELEVLIKKVTREDVINAARLVEPCVVYKLLPEEK